MFCTKCGSPLHDNQKFCNQCGAFVGAASEAPATFLVRKPDNRTGRKLAIAAFVLSGLSMLLSLVFASSVYHIFAGMEVSMSAEDWFLAIVTVFMYLLIKLIGVMLDALASASWYILPSLVLSMTGIALGIVSREHYKVKSFGIAPILLPIGALLLQLAVVVICFCADPTIPVV